MRLAREGLPFVAAAAALAGAGWVGYVLSDAAWVAGPAVLLTVLLLFVAYFFRDPDRVGPAEPGLVVAPADGRVLDVIQVNEPTFLQGPCRRVSIFLNIFNVHVQRAPVSGTVGHRSYRPGAYAVAWAEKASDDNEQASVGVDSPAGRVLVRQIAGLVARRIVTYPREGDRLDRGQRIGLIRFGSRVDLFLPLDWPVLCGPGDTVRGGVTPMARLPEEEAA